MAIVRKTLTQVSTAPCEQVASAMQSKWQSTNNWKMLISFLSLCSLPCFLFRIRADNPFSISIDCQQNTRWIKFYVSVLQKDAYWTAKTTTVVSALMTLSWPKSWAIWLKELRNITQLLQRQRGNHKLPVSFAIISVTIIILHVYCCVQEKHIRLRLMNTRPSLLTLRQVKYIKRQGYKVCHLISRGALAFIGMIIRNDNVDYISLETFTAFTEKITMITRCTNAVFSDGNSCTTPLVASCCYLWSWFFQNLCPAIRF